MNRNIKEVLNKPGFLDGIRVVEYGVFHAGLGCGAILGDPGAEVIKIEADLGDPMRHWTHVGKHHYRPKDGKNPMFESAPKSPKSLKLSDFGGLSTIQRFEFFNP